MPIFEYRCLACSEQFDVLLRSAKARPPSKCPHCGARRIERQLARFSVAHSELDTLRALDPKYKQMVDDEMRKTASYADPMRHLEKMSPLDAAHAPGDPLEV